MLIFYENKHFNNYIYILSQTNFLQRKIRTLNLQGSYYSCLVHLQRALPTAKGAEHRERSLCSRSRVRGNDNKKIRTICSYFLLWCTFRDSNSGPTD